jgi:MFS family permease
MRPVTMDVGIDVPALWLRLSRHRPSAAAARAAVSALFFLNGALFATWVSRIPAIQAQHALSHAALGGALLAAALGAILAMPLAGLLTQRFGSRPVCVTAALCYCTCMPLLAVASTTTTLVVALVGFGVVHGALDVAMNAQAVDVEKLYGRSIMSSFHAWFSGGGLAGALVGGLVADWHWRPTEHFAVVAVLLGVVAIVVWPRLHVSAEPSAATKTTVRRPFRIRFPKAITLALGAIAFCSMIGEGAMADWSALFLRDVRQVSDSFAAGGYAAFSVAMTIGRLIGDRLILRLGALRMVRLAALSVIAGLTVALLVPHPIATLIGFAGVGFGFATIVPLVFSAAGRVGGSASGVAIASVTTIGYLGFLAGPPLIGFLAEFIGLQAALGILIATTLLIVALAPAVARREPS